MTLCGCLTSILIPQKGIHTFAAIGLALVVSLLFGALSGALITKMRIPAFIATLATTDVLRGACYVMTNGKPVVFSKGLFTGTGGGYIGIFPLPAVYMVIAFAILWVVLNQTKFGRRIYAVGGNLVAARYSGVNTDRTIIVVYMISGFMSACSGILLISRLGSGQPTIGEGAETGCNCVLRSRRCLHDRRKRYSVWNIGRVPDDGCYKQYFESGRCEFLYTADCKRHHYSFIRIYRHLTDEPCY